MISHNQHEAIRPWAPVPTPRIPGYSAAEYDRYHAFLKARKQLYDLAPEMAEAILAFRRGLDSIYETPAGTAWSSAVFLEGQHAVERMAEKLAALAHPTTGAPDA